MIFSDIEKAGDLADQVAVQIKNSKGNLRVVYYKLEEILINYRKNNVDVDLIMPAIYEVDFEFNKTSPDGRSVWIAYADALHEDLCNPRGSLHKMVKLETNLKGASVINHIMAQLNLPPSSALLISPIAASILGLGVTAFCTHENKKCE
ncbi:MAG TPA: hypothetical protein VJU13_03560 [Candidatus Nitrosocosmicus sp.]|nr:hypothetical protein [Candidatus Nitrosocosmicus sp.]